MLERYVIVERIAVGGMGEVFVARQEGVGNFRRTVVLKKLLPDAEGSDEAAQRMLDEARINGALSHENVVTIIEVGTATGGNGELPWLALEYVHGENCGTLRTRAGKREIAIPLVVAARITADSARGLQHAHDAKDVEGRPLHIIHRDIAPKNIFVRHDGVSKVGDFGIARADARLSHTATGAIAGTLSYMSPEQLQGGELSPASDQFSLGIVFWELLTGRRLFKGDGPVDTAEKILTGKIRAPSRYRPDVSGPVDAIVLRMLDRDPKRRYPDLNEVADAIERAIKDATPTLGRAAVAAFMEEMCGNDLRERMKRIEEGAEQTTRSERSRSFFDDPSSSRRSATQASQSRGVDTNSDQTLREGPRGGRGDTQSQSGAASGSGTRATQDGHSQANPPTPRRSGVVIAAVVAVVVAVSGGAVVAWRSRTPDLNTLTLMHIEEAARTRPLTFREIVVDDAIYYEVPEADAEALAEKLTTLMRERFANELLQLKKSDDARAAGRIDAINRDQALIEKVRTTLKPWGTPDFRASTFGTWQHDSALPIRFLPALTPEQVQQRIYPNGVAHMRETRESRWSQVERLITRAGANVATVRTVLEPWVTKREAVMEKVGAAPASELVGLLEEMRALRARGRAALTPLIPQSDYADAIAAAAFFGVPDSEYGEAQIDEKALVVDVSDVPPATTP